MKPTPSVDETSRVETTLLTLVSVDGKITSGESDQLDSEWDWTRIRGVREGLHQYHQAEWAIAFNSLNTGRVMEKIGINTRRQAPEKDDRLNFFIVDRKPHLDENGLRYLAGWVGKLYIVTDNPSHPAFPMKPDFPNLEVVFYPAGVDFPDLFVKMKRDLGIEQLTIESGGTLNAILLRQGLIDHVILIVAPLLVGGSATSSLVDGQSLRTEDELIDLKALKLTRCEILEHSYLRLEYDVTNETVIEAAI
jgi:2,5-diamino-6-(ribosylamino)-4(3H)-pyrimidinone 5'-phosphate reductase